MSTLRSAQLPKDKEPQNVLKELRSLKDEVILPANKGNATVVTKRSNYDRRMKGMLDNSNQGSQRRTGSQYTTRRRKYPRAYTLLKLHKNNEIPKSIYNKIRPCGSCPTRTGAPSYKPFQYMASVISPSED